MDSENKTVKKNMSFSEIIKDQIPRLVTEFIKKGVLVICLFIVIWNLDYRNQKLEAKVDGLTVKMENYLKNDRQEMIDALKRNSEISEKLLLFLSTKTDYNDYHKN